MHVLGACLALVGIGTLVCSVAYCGNPAPVHCHSRNGAAHAADCHRHRVSPGTDSSLLVGIALAVRVRVRDGPAPRNSTLDESRQACHTPLPGAAPATRMHMHRTAPRVLVVANSACDRGYSWQAWNEHAHGAPVSLEPDETAQAPRESFRGVPDAQESRR